MSKYIDKDALIAEIERRMQELHPTNTHKMQVGEKVDRDVLMWLNALTWVKDFLNTLEVKEVNLNADVERYVEQHKNELKGYVDIRRIARYFFELGLKAQKGE